MPLLDGIITEVEKMFVGRRSIVRNVLATLLAGGHVLLEDIPGVGKTTLAVAFSKSLGLENKRIQFTPDVMPSDITGYTVLRRDTQEMEYQPGAVMCNFLLADEINRASARCQSALLEAMEEHTVTVDGTTYELPEPFIVIATQNPTGSSGTQLLPDSQTDRFMMRLSIGYPDEKAELEMVLRKHGSRPAQMPAQLCNAADLMQMRQQVSNVFIHPEIYSYILKLSRATREHPMIAQGASPRCTTALANLSQAIAFIEGRDYVVPEDVRSIYVPAAAHRLILAPQAKREQQTADTILASILESVRMPERSV